MRTPVTICPEPDRLVEPGRSRPSYVSVVLLRLLARATLLIGLVAALYGVVYEINAATRAGAPVAVFVRIRDLSGLQMQQAGLGKDSWLQAGTGPVTLHADGGTVAEWLASRGGGAVVGVCMGLGALLLYRLLLSIGGGQPFQRGNAARVAGMAGLVVVATVSAGVLPYIAARLVLDRLGLGGPGSPVAAHLTISAVPLLLALFLLALAEAFRRGVELAKDTEGLV
jgi:hypothetical protein